MIFVDRTKVKAPDILTKAGAAGLLERADAITNFIKARPHAKFKFKVYSEEEVKDALILLFNKKCAYCETRILASYPGDVEHFRPKGKITEALPPIDPGYYWLASDWDNLLLACKNCNSQKGHLVYGQAGKHTLGKMNQFPLHNFAHVRHHTIGIASEEPHRLLIDPCKDRPENHLEYGTEGNIIPRKDLHGNKSLKGATSILVYALQRMDLVDERKILRIEIELQQERVLEATLNFLEFLDSGMPEQTERFEKRAETEMKKLKAFTDSDQPYSAMATQMVREFLITQYDHIIPKVA